MDCGPYHVRKVDFVDVFRLYYYDIASGMLVAIYGAGIDWVAKCVGGPPGGITDDCTGPSGPDVCYVASGMPMDGGSRD